MKAKNPSQKQRQITKIHSQINVRVQKILWSIMSDLFKEDRIEDRNFVIESFDQIDLFWKIEITTRQLYWQNKRIYVYRVLIMFGASVIYMETTEYAW